MDVSYADIVGKIHSTAWKDIYKDIFLPEYINNNTSEYRKQECITVLANKKNKYYLIFYTNFLATMKEKFPSKNTKNSLDKEMEYCNKRITVM